ncbi:hypothetical protein AO263_09710 [Pseudomonas sp. NZIPFR-PS5]|nr:hypothetical protein AO263_09710 [Pseudomonas sp. NZIPFR-PS5]
MYQSFSLFTLKAFMNGKGGHGAGIGEEQPALISCRAGFSREGVSGYTAKVRVFTQASSRVKPVLLRSGMLSVGEALSYLKLAGTLHALHRTGLNGEGASVDSKSFTDTPPARTEFVELQISRASIIR